MELRKKFEKSGSPRFPRWNAQDNTARRCPGSSSQMYHCKCFYFLQITQKLATFFTKLKQKITRDPSFLQKEVANMQLCFLVPPPETLKMHRFWLLNSQFVANVSWMWTSLLSKCDVPAIFARWWQIFSPERPVGGAFKGGAICKSLCFSL